ncbi:MAG: hypothetical protein KF809_12500 [Chloroflexi bacterium]|nr:hypothetical protein [Chloroflexota bacterium]
MAIPDDGEDLVLEAQIAAPTEDGPRPDTPDTEPAEAHPPDVPPDDPQPGDPPPSVRGVAQELVDPPGDAADDGVRRWDPRTVRAPQREGG